MDGLRLVSVRAEKPAKNMGSLARTSAQEEKGGQEGEDKPPVGTAPVSDQPKSQQPPKCYHIKKGMSDFRMFLPSPCPFLELSPSLITEATRR
jgi:hypothetical protein